MPSPKTILMLMPLLIISCTQKTENTSVNKTPVEKKAFSAPASWREGLINAACGPDDGMINQLRLGWHVDHLTNSLRSSYPYLVVDYREAQDKTLQIFNAEYCKAAQQCEYSSADVQTLSISSAENSNALKGSYDIRLASGKRIAGKFIIKDKAAATPQNNIGMQCG